MKKLMTAFFALLLFPALPFAQEEMVSIAELRAQVQQMGRWTQTYTDQYGREIAVDVLPIIPEADAVPALRVASPVITEENVFNAFPADTVRITENESRIEYRCTDSESGADVLVSLPAPDKDRLTFYDTPNAGHIDIQYRQPDPARKSGSSQVIMLNGYYHMPYDIDYDTHYLGDDGPTVREALALAEERLSAFFPDYDLQLDLFRFGVTEATPPFYSLYIRQKIRDIPILLSAQCPVDNRLSDQTLGFKIPEEWRYRRVLSWGMFNYPGWMLDVSNTRFGLFCRPLKESGVLADDLPLCGMDAVMRAIEERIHAGYIRSVYSLRFGYCCYLDENEEIVLYPVWEIECDYLFNPKENMSVYKEHMEGPVTTRLYYRTMTVNAQTGEFIDPAQRKESLLYCPDIITWEDVR